MESRIRREVSVRFGRGKVETYWSNSARRNQPTSYNANGIRTGKTVSGVKHSYRLEGTKILSEKWGNNTLTPLYDNNDEVCGIVFNGASYYFLKNLQGDVISICKAYNIFCRRLLPEATELCKIYL